MSTAKIVALIVAFFAAIGALLFLIMNSSFMTPPVGDGMKRLSYTVAEGLVYKAHNEPFPRASCDACRTGKLKAGVLSLGAFNVIEFDNLVVNVPPHAAQKNLSEMVQADRSVVESLDLNPLLSMSNIKAKHRFYGIKINGFAINMMDGDTLKPVASARLVKNSGKRVVMKDVVLSLDGGETHLSEAELVTEPRLAIKWSSGMLDLSVLFF